MHIDLCKLFFLLTAYPVINLLNCYNLKRKEIYQQYSSKFFSLQVDLLKLSVFPVLKKFLGTDDGLELKVGGI